MRTLTIMVTNGGRPQHRDIISLGAEILLLSGTDVSGKEQTMINDEHSKTHEHK